jgi:alkanesulfonate monooxygenase SsuD/methylene tetrahydromethanopterin reductase-like flavin-dependent oxidoreductase (luciferase family)
MTLPLIRKMKFAIDVANFGEFGDPRVLAELARQSEEAGWDGFFIWDHILGPPKVPVADTTVALTAIALSTQSVRFGPMVTPLPRRSPWKVAREATTLDYLSGGRLTLGIGLGGDWFSELSSFGTTTDEVRRAEMLDEGLAILTGLMSQDKLAHTGKHFTVRSAGFILGPARSHVPIWIAGAWPRPRPFRRATLYDGVFPVAAELEKDLTPDETREIVAFIRKHRTNGSPFEVVHSGSTPGKSRAEDREIVAPYIAAGATWWVEGSVPWKMGIEQVRERIRFGPPHPD